MEPLTNIKIIQRHYDTLIKQGYDNLPYETGGFVGGLDGVILAILPTFNKDWDQNTDVYALESEDITRAHSFFKKHNYDYFGAYHTHPKGIAYPSEQDIKTGQKYHFIISYKDENKPQFAAYRIDNNKPVQLPISIVPDSHYTKVDIHRKASESKADESTLLNSRIQNIINDQPNSYDRLPPKEGELGSDFSTFA